MYFLTFFVRIFFCKNIFLTQFLDHEFLFNLSNITYFMQYKLGYIENDSNKNIFTNLFNWSPEFCRAGLPQLVP